MTATPHADRAGVVLTWAPAPHERMRRRAVAWDLLRDLLAQAGAPEATLSNPCTSCGGPHGAVIVAGAPWRASVSYAGGFAVVGIAPRSTRAFGLDAEPDIDVVRDAAGWPPGATLSWVRAEAALKADGRGLRIDPSEVDVIAHRAGWIARVPGAVTALQGWEPAGGPPGLIVSVAIAQGPADRADLGGRATH